MNADSDSKAAFKVDLGSSKKIASFYLLNPVFNDAEAAYTPLSEGKITVGDDPDVLSNPTCVSGITGSGYYSCTEPLEGRYISYL